ncbi:MAG: carboxypeptidase regulatory-like domain-containing protein [Archangium sp.]|nr:carboxypeptidase regulatory-like domain-containing protein [Archangium sp.]
MRPLLLVAAVVLAGCASNAPLFPGPATCESDAQCDEGQLCFPEGCADPAKDVVVEVAGNSSLGMYPQDFAVPDGTLGQRLDFTVAKPSVLIGELQRERSTGIDPTNRDVFTEAVVVRATGESELIPGVRRSYETRFNQTERGVFSMTVGVGRFTVMALPVNSSVPPTSVADIRVIGGQETPAPMSFPSVEGTVVLTGRLLKYKSSSVTSSAVAMTDVAMDLQAFNAIDGQPLSQRVPVSSGLPASTGDFILSLNPSALKLNAVQLVASPRESGTLVPTKTFSVAVPFMAAVTLEMGDFGLPVAVKGRVLDVTDTPVASASVVLSGVARGGGRFRSKVVLTDESGSFAVDALPNEFSTPYTLTVVPLPASRAAVAAPSVNISSTYDGAPITVRCGDRAVVTGVVSRPDGTPAAQVRIRAVDQASTPRALPVDDVEGVTNADGSYSLTLDVGQWLLEFLPGGALPRMGRGITVQTELGGGTGRLREPQVIAPVRLPNGRRVSGAITDGLTTQALAVLRFFRVAPIGGKTVSVFLGSTLSDERGQYELVLPTR